MKCLNPQRLHRDTNKTMVIRCGSCIACRQNYAATWAGRLYMEHINHPSAYFVGLNYSDINLPMSKKGFPTLCKRHVQLYLKRLRKEKSFRYYIAGEYSDVERPHYHMCIFYERKTDFRTCLNHVWKHWYYSELIPDVRPLEPRHYTYVTKYLVKRLTGDYKKIYVEMTGCLPEFSLLSRNPYLGYCPTYKIKKICVDRGIYGHDHRYPLHTIYMEKLKYLYPDFWEILHRQQQEYIFEEAKKTPIYTAKEKKRILEFHERRELWRRSIIHK